MINELREIEKRVKFNSDLIIKAVLTLDQRLLDDLIGWSKVDIKNIKSRLLDKDFSWTKGVEASLPFTKKQEGKIISSEITSHIIQEILKERKSHIK